MNTGRLFLRCFLIFYRRINYDFSAYLLYRNKFYDIHITNKDEENPMAVQYNKLWKMLIDKKIKKSALTPMAGISASTIAKLSHDEYVSLEILERICRSLHCEIGDVVEITKEAER